MKRYVLFCAGILLAINGLSAQMTVNGILDSSVSMSAGKDLSFGIEEYANIRFQSRLRDNRAVVYGAVNLIAAAGDYALAMTTVNHSGVVAGENYAAAIELERLYFRLNFETAVFDAGLFRLPFGYSQVWGSSDFLNPRNPLKPDARPRGILGTGLSFYPNDEIKLLGFFAAPRDPFLNNGDGILTGLSMDWHFEKGSIQALYSFEFPNDGAGNGIHRSGFSVKADLEVSLVLDLLYAYNNEQKTGIDGLSLSAGADYSFFDGNMIVLGEYLYNGETSSTAYDPDKNILGLLNRHCIYTGVTWRFNDFTNLNGAVITSINDFSFTPVLTLNHDLFQGAVLTAIMQIPLDSGVFNGEKDFSLICSVRLRLRF